MMIFLPIENVGRKITSKTFYFIWQRENQCKYRAQIAQKQYKGNTILLNHLKAFHPKILEKTQNSPTLSSYYVIYTKAF